MQKEGSPNCFPKRFAGKGMSRNLYKAGEEVDNLIEHFNKSIINCGINTMHELTMSQKYL